MSLNTISLFKSASARRLQQVGTRGSSQGRDGSSSEDQKFHALASPQGQMMSGETEEEEGRRQGQGQYNKSASAHQKDREGSHHSLHHHNSEKEKEKEPYTMDSYVEHIKTNYISGDASVLMFGATACRQVSNLVN